jgi:hypothetical protein
MHDPEMHAMFSKNSNCMKNLIKSKNNEHENDKSFAQIAVSQNPGAVSKISPDIPTMVYLALPTPKLQVNLICPQSAYGLCHKGKHESNDRRKIRKTYENDHSKIITEPFTSPH